MRVLFIPDLIKYEEEFFIEGTNLAEVLNKLQDEFPYNCLLGVYIPFKHGLSYLGVLKVEEYKSPEWCYDV